MPKRHLHQRTEITYNNACELLEHALSNGVRGRILDALSASADFEESAIVLRNAMRSHSFPTGAEPLRLHRIVQSFDTRARRAGLHVLESWDYVAHRFASEITPVLMLDRCALDRIAPSRQRAALSVLLDHYFMSVLGLVVARAWDEGDPNENLERAGALLRALQGSDASDCRFVDDVETLMLTSVSHYHPDEQVYERIVRRFDILDPAPRRRMALACAAILGGHLRWGLRFMYRRDVSLMRDDNIVDYPFVIFGILNLLRDYETERLSGVDDIDHARTIEGILNGLSADPDFAASNTPRWLRSHHEEHAELRDRLLDNRDALLGDLGAHQPTSRSYSPLGFDANFLCNTVVAMVATSLGEAGPRPSLNALFTRLPHDGATPDDAERQAQSLMRYAVGNRLSSEAPLVVYDSCEAAHAFNVTNATLRQKRSLTVGSA